MDDYIIDVREKTLVELLAESDARKNAGPWVPASGGTEKPFFTKGGRRLQYLWQPSSGKHAYIDCDTDIILTDADAALYLEGH